MRHSQTISHFCHRFDGWGAALGVAYCPGLCDTKVSINKVSCETLILPYMIMVPISLGELSIPK